MTRSRVSKFTVRLTAEKKRLCYEAKLLDYASPSEYLRDRFLNKTIASDLVELGYDPELVRRWSRARIRRFSCNNPLGYNQTMREGDYS